MVRVYATDIDKWLRLGIPEDLESFLSEYRREEYRRRKKLLAACQSAAAELLLKSALKRENISLPISWSWEQEPDGKPYVRELAGISFNLSHSETYIACAVGNMPVGVDVQVMKPGCERVAARWFGVEESQEIALASDPAERFCQIWTAKEAYLKMLGSGLRKPLNSFRVKIDEGYIETPESDHGCHLAVYRIKSGVYLSACSKEEIGESYIHIDSEELVCE